MGRLGRQIDWVDLTKSGNLMKVREQIASIANSTGG